MGNSSWVGVRSSGWAWIQECGMGRGRFTRPLVWSVAASAVVAGLVAPAARGETQGRLTVGHSEWPMYGHDEAGSRVNPDATGWLGAISRSGLQTAWRLRTPGPVYGTPAVSGGHVYAADAAGNVYSLVASTGAVVWIAHVGPAADFPLVVTASPLVTDHTVVIGDQDGVVWGLDRSSGVVRWVQRPNNFGYPAIYGSPTLATVRTPTGPRGVVLVPIASNEETLTPSDKQPCCSSRGSIAALDPSSGAVLWQTYLITDSQASKGAAGASVWSTPTYDAELNRVYITTGNNYGNRSGTPTTKTSEAIIALDAASGRIIWDNQRTPDDTWSYAYRGFSDGHQDFDFGDSAKLVELADGTRAVAAGQKSGFFHVVDAISGRTIDEQQYLPGGGFGGFFADSATANGVIFAPGNDWPGFGGGELGAIAGSPPPKTGSVVALAVGAARQGGLIERWRFNTPGSPMMGGIAIAGDVVFVQATRAGRLYALDAATGRVLAALPVGPGINGPAIAEGRLFLGTGDVTGPAAYDPTSGAVVAVEPRHS
jgi:outer membrane protein assembly factor BamB